MKKETNPIISDRSYQHYNFNNKTENKDTIPDWMESLTKPLKKAPKVDIEKIKRSWP